MHLSKHIRTRRHGFTLVELLVVIAIIAILVGLISAAVVKALAKGSEARNAAEIRQLSAAVQAFLREYGVDYLPSRIVLANRPAQYRLTDPNPVIRQLHQDSLNYINRLFPRIDWSQVDWRGSGTGPWELQGDQCLVFFLGGMPRSVSGVLDCNGFSTNPKNPTLMTGERKPILYDFKPSRLVNRGGFLVYRDAYDQQPIAYFSSYKQRNGYNRYGSTDCANLNVFPYASSFPPTAVLYANPDTWQIISAGADGVFSPGTNTAARIWSARSPGAFIGSDDQCNFHDLLIGVAGE